MSYQPGQGTSCILDEDDPNYALCVEGSALYRVRVGGRWTEIIGSCWYVRVTTGADDEYFYGLAQQAPSLNDRLTALHEGIRRALPDLEEGEPVAMTHDDPLTHVGAANPGRLVVWTAAVAVDMWICNLERYTLTDDETIFVRLGRV